MENEEDVVFVPPPPKKVICLDEPGEKPRLFVRPRPAPVGMSEIAHARLIEERKRWRKDHPYGFIAKPMKSLDGSLNLFHWDCAVPGKKGTVWEGGLYRLRMSFSDQFPYEPPKCTFRESLFHPNISMGRVCVSLLNKDWNRALTIKHVLLGIQQLLNEPNPNDPFRPDACDLYVHNRAAYERCARSQAKQYSESIVLRQMESV